MALAAGQATHQLDHDMNPVTPTSVPDPALTGRRTPGLRGRTSLPAGLFRAAELLLLAVAPALGFAAWDHSRRPVAPPAATAAATATATPGAVPPGQIPTGASVSASEVVAWQRLGAGAVLWVDARPPALFAQGQPPGAAALNEDQWDELLPSILERWSPGVRTVVFCDGGDCRSSERVAARLRDAGLGPVFFLRGGWPAWREAASAAEAGR